MMNWTVDTVFNHLTHPSSTHFHFALLFLSLHCLAVVHVSSGCLHESDLNWIDVYAKQSLWGWAQWSMWGLTWRLRWCLWSAAEMKGLQETMSLSRNTSALRNSSSPVHHQVPVLIFMRMYQVCCRLKKEKKGKLVSEFKIQIIQV